MNLPFSMATYRERLCRVKQAMQAANVDALITTLPDSIHWLTGFDTIGYLWNQALILDHGNTEPLLVTRTTEAPGAAETCWLESPLVYDIMQEDPAEILITQLKSRGLAASTIGLDLSAFTLVPAMVRRIRDGLPELRIVDSTWLIAEARLIKEPRELQYQQQAAAMADYAVQRVLEAIRPGVSETELSGLASLALGEAGSEYAAIPPMVVSGERSTLVHALASRRTLSVGDVVCIELAGVVHRYHAVVMRSAVVGRANSRVREVYDCLDRAMSASVNAIKPGVNVSSPDRACNEVLGDLNLVKNRCHRIGYSLGLAYPPGWLEPMTLVDGDKHVFEANMSFTVEPNLALPEDGFGFKLGETVLCTSEGASSLSALPRTLVEAT